MSLAELGKLVETGEKELAEELAKKLLAEGVKPIDIFDALTRTMDHVGAEFAKLEIFLPEVMLAGEALTGVVDVVRPALLAEGGRAGKGKIVLGVARGDLHEIGKNIVKLMLEVNGFEVKDLGYDVDSLTFVKEAEAFGADVIGISALMTTTMPGQKEVIKILEAKGMRDKFKVVVGGAPVTKEWAKMIGADLYCENANGAPAAIEALLGR